jgi:predicted amidophosphoribosyltransferase
MPRLIVEKECPHCGAQLPVPKPTSCPECMGSLQQRFLRAGCLSSAPPILLACVAGGALARIVLTYLRTL